MRILSLFDGISCARLALKDANISVEKYWASEVDLWASAVARKQFPDIIELGDIRQINILSVDKPIDLLIGGSPCQDLTRANAGRRGLKGERSGLFFEYLRIKNEIKPQWFILENVGSMSQQNRDIVTDYIGVKPIIINSKIFVPQSRKRYYWTNIPVVIPDEPDVFPQLSSIIEKDLSEEAMKTYYLSKKHKIGIERSFIWKETKLDCCCGTLMASYYKRPPYGPYIPHRKSPSGYRMLTAIECERIQGVPDNYTTVGIFRDQYEKDVEKIISTTQRYKMLGNGFTVPVVTYLLQFIPNNR